MDSHMSPGVSTTQTLQRGVEELEQKPKFISSGGLRILGKDDDNELRNVTNPGSENSLYPDMKHNRTADVRL